MIILDEIKKAACLQQHETRALAALTCQTAVLTRVIFIRSRSSGRAAASGHPDRAHHVG
jgi:hypothetical protein